MREQGCLCYLSVCMLAVHTSTSECDAVWACCVNAKALLKQCICQRVLMAKHVVMLEWLKTMRRESHPEK